MEKDVIAIGASAGSVTWKEVFTSFSEKDIKRLTIAFDAADLDGSGGISLDEFKRLCHDHQATREEDDGRGKSWLRMLFNSVDTDRSGEIDFTEFLTSVFHMKKREDRSGKEPQPQTNAESEAQRNFVEMILKNAESLVAEQRAVAIEAEAKAASQEASRREKERQAKENFEYSGKHSRMLSVAESKRYA